MASSMAEAGTPSKYERLLNFFLKRVSEATLQEMMPWEPQV